MQFPQHWWSDRSEATLITDIHTRSFGGSAIEFLTSERTVNIYRVLTLIAQNLVSAPSSQAFVERLFSVCGMLTVGPIGRRNRMDKSLHMRAWLKVNHDSLVDMGMWTHWTVCKGVRCPPIFSLFNLINAGWLVRMCVNIYIHCVSKKVHPKDFHDNRVKWKPI